MNFSFWGQLLRFGPRILPFYIIYVKELQHNQGNMAMFPIL